MDQTHAHTQPAAGHAPVGHAPDAHGDHDDHGHHDAHHVNYLIVFGALCLFTLLSILADAATLLGLPYAVMVVLVLSVATAKAVSVMLYFMHLKFERNWKYVLLAPTIILALGIPLALLPDVGLHYYVQDVPQMREAGHEDHHAGQLDDQDGAKFPPKADGGH